MELYHMHNNHFMCPSDRKDIPFLAGGNNGLGCECDDEDLSYCCFCENKAVGRMRMVLFQVQDTGDTGELSRMFIDHDKHEHMCDGCFSKLFDFYKTEEGQLCSVQRMIESKYDSVWKCGYRVPIMYTQTFTAVRPKYPCMLDLLKMCVRKRSSLLITE